MIPSKEAKTILIANGITTPIYRYVLPEEEKSGIDCIMLSDQGGPGNDGDIGFSLLQVIVRSFDSDEGYELCKSIQTILEATTADANFAGFVTESDIIFLNRDLNQRDIFMINFTVMKQTI
jgi:hypothetical protein